MHISRSRLNDQHFEAIIIGAGMAGLAAGIRLAIAGKKTLILERHNASGGLNSFYSIDGRKYDVGLHAMTNYVPKGTKGTPLAKLLRQLRLDYEAFELSPQNGSRILFPGRELQFNNDFSLLESEVGDKFPREIDAFRRLADEIRSLDAFSLANNTVSARDRVRHFIQNPLLEDMLFCPVMYYGSAQEHDMDYAQFAIMFRSLFFEGFARPYEGVRVIIRVLQDKYRSLGGIRKMKHGVQRIHTSRNRVTALELDNGDRVTADQILSTAGAVETALLCEPGAMEKHTRDIGQLSFTETISILDRQPADFGWRDTIVFFNTRERFQYAAVKDQLVDPTSGVICFPNNYQYPNSQPLAEGIMRLTALANYDRWCDLAETEYREQKEHWYQRLQEVAIQLLPPENPALKIEQACIAKDMFTPRTVYKYTGHLNGAIYGSPNKIKDGRTPYQNLFLAGTDQGFLGIVGAMLSGISMANLHLLQNS